MMYVLMSTDSRECSSVKSWWTSNAPELVVRQIVAGLGNYQGNNSRSRKCNEKNQSKITHLTETRVTKHCRFHRNRRRYLRSNVCQHHRQDYRNRK